MEFKSQQTFLSQLQHRSVFPTFLAFGLFAAACVAPRFDERASSEDLEYEAAETWRATLMTQQLGPLEADLEVVIQGDRIRGHLVSEALGELRAFPKAQGDDVALEDHLFAFEVHRTSEGSNDYEGRLVAPWSEEGLKIQMNGNQLTGAIDHWLLGGALEAHRGLHGPISRDYHKTLRALDRVVSEKIFDPKLLAHSGYRAFRERFESVVEAATNDLDLVLGFHFAWEETPFSHFQLRRSDVNAEALFQRFDAMEVGYEAARVEIDGDLAVLRVDTMMGADTIRQIQTAYETIAASGVETLVIDLRGNGGGAFAVKPLVEHVVDAPITSGYFLSQRWGSESLPTVAQLERIEPWEGWSISSFWREVQELDVMKLRFEPREPNFDGDVFVLVDRWSASATELAVDVFRSSGVARIVGETTAGQMLSQSFFDLEDGFLIGLPIADYYSLNDGRIEGRGIQVDIVCEPDTALDLVRELL